MWVMPAWCFTHRRQERDMSSVYGMQLSESFGSGSRSGMSDQMARCKAFGVVFGLPDQETSGERFGKAGTIIDTSRLIQMLGF